MALHAVDCYQFITEGVTEDIMVWQVVGRHNNVTIDILSNITGLPLRHALVRLLLCLPPGSPLPDILC